MWLSLMPKRQWSRCMWYPASFPLVWEILPGADRLLWVGGGPSVAASNWLTWSGSRHTCEFLTLLGGASPGAGLLLWSLWPSKRWLWLHLLSGSQWGDDSLPLQMAGMYSCTNKNFLLDHQDIYLVGTGPCRILLLGVTLQHLCFIVSLTCPQTKDLERNAFPEIIHVLLTFTFYCIPFSLPPAISHEY